MALAAERDVAGSAPGWALAVRELRHWLTNYRRTWRGTIYSGVLNPLLYLTAIGVGLGTLVNQHGAAKLGGMSYLAFLAPGLLAATALHHGLTLVTRNTTHARRSGADVLNPFTE